MDPSPMDPTSPKEKITVFVIDTVDKKIVHSQLAQEVTYEPGEDEESGRKFVDRDLDVPEACDDIAKKHAIETGHETAIALSLRRYASVQLSKIIAPWTDKQVSLLEEYQANSRVHPYTCQCGEVLIPTREGWYCMKCHYRQDWAWDVK